MTEFSRRLAFFAAVLATLMALGCASVRIADYEAILEGVTSADLDEATVLAGLKDALKVGSGNAVTTTSTVDGFLGGGM